jgi:hypothetical protein
MMILVFHLPNPRSTMPRAGVDMLSKAEEIGQDHQVMLLVSGINLFFHQHIHHRIVQWRNVTRNLDRAIL